MLCVEEHFPDTRRFADHWAVKRLANQYWSQRNYQLRMMRDSTSSSKAKDDVPARNIPCLIPTYKVPMQHIRTKIGYDQREWNRLRTCLRENIVIAKLKWSLHWRFQKPEKLRQIYDAVENQFPEMRRFAEQWAAKAMTKVFWDSCKRRGRQPFSLFTDEPIDSPKSKSTKPIKKNKTSGRGRGRPPKNKHRRILDSI
ncbi:hypothetical protein DFH05DRAFT_1112443 [Lentinula detonsa]|uniref:Uncharacterized protein n=1 Tax=Lentinula detonsa TaxID=2804962 RepID=A0A9W8P1L7_9AGAR|nr:hypothetical protein DFH05DRAFT_1112443 [Lentinula detonsa]